MLWHRAKRDPVDQLFSQYIRTRDAWRCVRCNRYFGDRPGALQCSHYFSRIHESTRFDPENCDSLCAYCHSFWGHGEGHDDYRAFKINQLGPLGFRNLELRSQTYFKRDRKTAYLFVKQLMASLKQTGAA